MNRLTKIQLQKALLKWHSSNKRDFYWRRNKISSYHFLLLEMLLRKTKADNVERIFIKFIEILPKPIIFNKKFHNKIKKILQPLGLSSIRTKAIADINKIITRHYAGKVPKKFSLLIKMPHVGRYTANAVLCFAGGEKTAIVDTNIARIYCRMLNINYPVEIHKDENLWKTANTALPNKKYKEFNYALIDLGALICKKRPLCQKCPLSKLCSYSKDVR